MLNVGVPCSKGNSPKQQLPTALRGMKGKRCRFGLTLFQNHLLLCLIEICSAEASCWQGSWDSLYHITVPPPCHLGCRESCIIQQGYLLSSTSILCSAKQAAVDTSCLCCWWSMNKLQAPAAWLLPLSAESNNFISHVRFCGVPFVSKASPLSNNIKRDYTLLPEHAIENVAAGVAKSVLESLLLTSSFLFPFKRGKYISNKETNRWSQCVWFDQCL